MSPSALPELPNVIVHSWMLPEKPNQMQHYWLEASALNLVFLSLGFIAQNHREN